MSLGANDLLGANLQCILSRPCREGIIPGVRAHLRTVLSFLRGTIYVMLYYRPPLDKFGLIVRLNREIAAAASDFRPRTGASVHLVQAPNLAPLGLCLAVMPLMLG